MTGYEFSFFVLGILLYLMIYHLFVFFDRKSIQENKYGNISFGIICFSYSLVIFNRGIYPNLEIYNKDLNIIIDYIFTIMISGSTALFCHSIFNLDGIKKFSIGYFIFVVISGIILHSFYFCGNKQIKIVSIHQFIIFSYALIFFILLVWQIIKLKQWKSRQNRLLIISLFILLLSMIIMSIIMILKEVLSEYIIYTPFLFMCLVFNFILTKTFNNEHKELETLKNNLEYEVLEKTGEIKELYKQRENYFVNIAHEIKTPLTLIDSYVEKYINDYGENQEIEVIKNNIKKLKKDMLNFLSMKNFEQGKINYNHNQIISFSDALEEKINTFKNACLKKEIKFRSNIEKDIHIKIDPYALEQIINNLLENACKFNKDKEIIDIGLESINKRICFIVKDKGIGINKDKIEHIFTPYYQITNSKQNLQGVGMGLSIIKKIVESIDGSIEVESQVGYGTTFNIYFNEYKPKKEDDIEVFTEIIKPVINIINLSLLKDSNIEDNKYNIMILEDNIDMLYFLQENLKKAYNVFFAVNGKDAFDKLNLIKKVDLVISDVMMDIMDGFTFIKKLSEDDRFFDIPVIFLSANQEIESKMEGLHLGALDYLIKPFVIEELLSKTESILKLQESREKVVIKKMTEELKRKIVKEKSDNKKSFEDLVIEYEINQYEKEIIELIINENLQYKEIAFRKNLSTRTVEWHIGNVYKKII